MKGEMVRYTSKGKDAALTKTRWSHYNLKTEWIFFVVVPNMIAKKKCRGGKKMKKFGREEEGQKVIKTQRC